MNQLALAGLLSITGAMALADCTKLSKDDVKSAQAILKEASRNNLTLVNYQYDAPGRLVEEFKVEDFDRVKSGKGADRKYSLKIADDKLLDPSIVYIPKEMKSYASTYVSMSSILENCKGKAPASINFREAKLQSDAFQEMFKSPEVYLATLAAQEITSKEVEVLLGDAAERDNFKVEEGSMKLTRDDNASKAYISDSRAHVYRTSYSISVNLKDGSTIQPVEGEFSITTIIESKEKTIKGKPAIAAKYDRLGRVTSPAVSATPDRKVQEVEVWTVGPSSGEYVPFPGFVLVNPETKRPVLNVADDYRDRKSNITLDEI